jgi:predicted GIY-YIG superfamily endonuclease
MRRRRRRNALLSQEAVHSHFSMPYYSYILASRPGGALNVGVTNNLARRIRTHKTGRGGDQPRRYGNDRRVYDESPPDIADAIQRELSSAGREPGSRT